MMPFIWETMMKRVLVYVLMLLLTVLCPLAQADSTLTVANPNPLVGSFFTSLWGRGTSDFDVKSLIHGYDLIRWDSEKGMFAHDPSVVRQMTVMDNALGDRSYVFVLADDLFYSDGTKITAWDYAFSVLLQIAPEIEELSGIPERKEFLIGYDKYMDGTLSCLPGVHVAADNVLVLTLDHRFLPFFYEMGLLSCSPYPIHVIAPGVSVRDDGNGVYLANTSGTGEPLFTARNLQQTLQDPVSGYITFPPVVSGPYIMNSWDGTTATFTRNERYKGNLKGEKPVIDRLIYTYLPQEEMLERFESGEIDLLNKVIQREEVTAGEQQVRLGSARQYRYPRTGLSFVSFACENKAVSFQSVRQAIACCMDKDGIIKAYVGDDGEKVAGYYGIGQWMYRAIAGLAEDALGRDWPSLSLDPYDLDVSRAIALLEAEGFKVNEQTGIREKQMPDGSTVTLSLHLACPEENDILPAFEQYWFSHLEKAGIHVETVRMPMRQMVRKFYGWDPRENIDMFFLGSNFDILFDPSLYFGTDQERSWFCTRLEDEELVRRITAMRETRPGDVVSYAARWVAFQERFNEMLPMIPVYSNTYTDFAIPELLNYRIEDNVSWANAILSCTLDQKK